MYYLEHWGSRWVGSFFAKKQRAQAQLFRLKTTTSSVSRRYTGRMSFSRLFACGPSDSSYLVRSFLVTRMQEDWPYASTRGRDHIVNAQSERQNLVIVNVHFELELTLRRLRERLRLITPHWPSYPNAVGILGDFNICEQEEGRFNVWNQTFTVTRERPPGFIPFFACPRECST